MVFKHKHIALGLLTTTIMGAAMAANTSAVWYNAPNKKQALAELRWEIENERSIQQTYAQTAAMDIAKLKKRQAIIIQAVKQHFGGTRSDINIDDLVEKYLDNEKELTELKKDLPMAKPIAELERQLADLEKLSGEEFQQAQQREAAEEKKRAAAYAAEQGETQSVREILAAHAALKERQLKEWADKYKG